MDTIATLTSVSLQYGVPLEDLVRKFAYQRFEPSGFTKNPQIRQATSIVDYIFRWMGTHFVPGYAESQKSKDGNGQADTSRHDQLTLSTPATPVAPLTVTSLAPRPHVSVAATPLMKPNGSGLSSIIAQFQTDAPICSECGSQMIRSGACHRCPNCGSSSGCAG